MRLFRENKVRRNIESSEPPTSSIASMPGSKRDAFYRAVWQENHRIEEEHRQSLLEHQQLRQERVAIEERLQTVQTQVARFLSASDKPIHLVIQEMHKEQEAANTLAGFSQHNIRLGPPPETAPTRHAYQDTPPTAGPSRDSGMAPLRNREETI